MKHILSKKKWLRIISMCSFLLLTSIFLGLFLGSKELSLADIWQQTESLSATILWQVRLPRVLMAASIGLALASSGTLFQGLLRNSLADPYILGISGGAALGSVLSIAFHLPAGAHFLAAFLAALLASACIYWLAQHQATPDRSRLLLIGVIFNAFCFAGILLFNSLANISEAYQVMLMLMGSIPANSLQSTLLVSGLVLISFISCILLSPQLNQLCFRVNENLSTELSKSFLLFYLLATFFVALAVATSGLIGFVGLCIPHIARLLVGSDHRLLIPVSGILGAAFLSLADSFARSAFFMTGFATELPVGVITAFLGAPFFLYLLMRNKRGELC